MESKTLDSDLVYEDGTLEWYDCNEGSVWHDYHTSHTEFGDIGYDHNPDPEHKRKKDYSVTTKSVHSFGVYVIHDETEDPDINEHYLTEVNFSLDGHNKDFSYKVQIGEEDGNVAWIIPYKKGQVSMTNMKDILISGTNYACEVVNLEKTWTGGNLPFHESMSTSVTHSNSYINCLDIDISDSNTFTFEKGNYAKSGTRLGALTTEGSLILTNVGQVALTDNIGTVLMGSKFSMTEGESAVFSGNSLHVFDHSEVSLTNVSKVEFKNNKDSVFYTTPNYGSAPYDTSMTFTNCGEVVFSDNEAEDGVIVGRSSDSGSDEFMLFENCDTVTVERNHATKKRLFVIHQPKFKGCTNVTLSNNQADHGEVFGRQLNFEEIKGSIKINDNISAAAGERGDGTFGYLVTGNYRGEIIASGVAGQTATMEINGNSGTGN